MTEMLTAAQMRAIEQAAIDSGEVTGLELMERAGRGVVEAVFEEWPELKEAPYSAVVLCGPGNNGGDGFVVARLLKEWGWDVEVFLYGDPDKLPPDARTNYERWRSFGTVELLPFPDFAPEQAWKLVERWECNNVSRTVIIDALFGTGMTRAVGRGLHTLFQSIGMSLRTDEFGAFPIVAIDVPSGHCSDSGKRLEYTQDPMRDYNAIDANLTVSFHALKTGHLLEECPQFCGRTVVKSIGLEDSARPRAEAKRPPMGADGCCPAEPDDIVRLVAQPDTRETYKRHGEHKYTHGHALILTGGPGKTGAARLAARGALRIGAGLVTLGVPPSAQLEAASQLTAIMLERVADAEALAAILEDERKNALCMGPGLGLQEESAQLVVAGLANARPTVLDADALTLIARDPALFAALHEDCVLTPHGGEFQRLFPDISEKLNAPATMGPAYSKVDATRDAAKRAGCTVMFKGPGTIIAAPDGRCSINAALYDRAAPWLATAGSGDVLAGFITGLLARGLNPMQAAETATWLHVECARSFGPGLIAEDLPEELPKVFRNIGL